MQLLSPLSVSVFWLSHSPVLARVKQEYFVTSKCWALVGKIPQFLLLLARGMKSSREGKNDKECYGSSVYLASNILSHNCE